MTHEEQISLFEALALNGAWSNAACTGYCLLAMQRAGLDEKTIEKVLHELHWAFDDTSVEQAEKILPLLWSASKYKSACRQTARRPYSAWKQGISR